MGGKRLQAVAAAAELPTLITCRLLLHLAIAAAVFLQPAMFPVHVSALFVVDCCTAAEHSRSAVLECAMQQQLTLAPASSL